MHQHESECRIKIVFCYLKVRTTLWAHVIKRWYFYYIIKNTKLLQPKLVWWYSWWSWYLKQRSVFWWYSWRLWYLKQGSIPVPIKKTWKEHLKRRIYLFIKFMSLQSVNFVLVIVYITCTYFVHVCTLKKKHEAKLLKRHLNHYMCFRRTSHKKLYTESGFTTLCFRY